MHAQENYIDDNEAYHADKTRIGKSGLDLIHQSPLHYYAKYLDPNRKWEKQTDALLMGSVNHMLLFEPKLFASKYIVCDDDKICAQIGGKSPRSTTKYKEWYAEFETVNKGKTVIEKEVLDTALAMQSSVMEHPAASVLLEGGIAEQRIDFTWNGYDRDGNEIIVPCKMKPDWQAHNGFIVDLKTTADASPEGFGKSFYNYRYHVQGAFYTDGFTIANGGPPRGFIFIAVEKTPPYAVAVYYMTPEQLDMGRAEYEADLRTYKRCLQTGNFHGYPTEVMPIQMPGWAFKKSVNNNIKSTIYT